MLMGRSFLSATFKQNLFQKTWRMQTPGKKNRITFHFRLICLTIHWIYPPRSNSHKWRFIWIPYKKCNIPSDDCYWVGGGYIQTIQWICIFRCIQFSTGGKLVVWVPVVLEFESGYNPFHFRGSHSNPNHQAPNHQFSICPKNHWTLL